MTRYTLQPAIEDDKEPIRSLNERCYREVVERQFGEWNEEVQDGFFENKWATAKYQKILVDGRLTGILSLQRHADHVFLSEIQIDSPFQRQGLGTTVLRDILDNALDCGLPVRLQVLHQNRAIGLYRRLGFVTTGETETHVFMEKSGPPADNG